MLHIKCYKEKRCLIAYYFCGKEKIDVTPESVFALWNNWWKYDFTRNGHKPYKVVRGQLGHNANDPNKDDAHLKACNRKFKETYKWVRDYVKKHTKPEVKDAVARQRIRQLAELKTVAGKKNLKAIMLTREVKSGNLAHYQLVGKKFKKDGSYESLLQYLNNM